MVFLTVLACTATQPATESDTDRLGTSVADDVEGTRYQADLEQLSVPRPPGSAGWQAAQDLCFDRLAMLGFETERQDYGSGINVIGRLPGASPSAGAVVISAHYDSVEACNGADDNASGVAGALEAARVLASGIYAEDLIVACWDEEERGLVGSDAWVSANTDPIQLAWSLEMIGYKSDQADSQELPFGLDFVFPDAVAEIDDNDNRGDFIAFVADEDAATALASFQVAPGSTKTIDLLLANDQINSPLFADLQRSDHAVFWEAGHSAVMLTDTANFRNTHYHCAAGEDSVDRLDMEFAAGTIRGLVGATATLLGSMD